MTGRKLFQIALIIIRQMKNPYYRGFAAQLAFYFMLSIVPIMIVLSQLLGVFSISLDALDTLINQYVSEEVAEILMDFIAYAPTGPMNAVFVVTAIWAASQVQFSLIRMTNYTFTEGQSIGKGYFRDRLKAVRTILITLFTVSFALVILAYGEHIFTLFLNTVNVPQSVKYGVERYMLYLRWPVAMALYFLMVCYNYYVLPYVKVKFKDILPGSIFASVSMLVVTYIFTGYTRYATHLDILYGSLASIVVLMFWFFFISWALGLGILFNKAWADTKAAR